MSALALVCKSQSVEILTDAAFVDADNGVVGYFGGKQFRYEKLPGVRFANNGWMPPATSFAFIAGETCRTFDELVRASDDIWREVRRELRDNWPADCCVVFAGWSEERNEAEAYDIYNSEHHRGGPLSILCLGPVDGARIDTESLVRDFADCPDSFDAERDGIPLMEKLRTHRRQFGTAFVPSVGGYIQHATISKDGIQTRIIHHWPDQVGRPIVLEAA